MRRITIILLTSYLIVTLIFFLGVLLPFYDFSYSGYYIDKIINWTWLGLTILICFNFWKNKAVKIYFFSLLTILALSILPMAIPFIGIVNHFSTMGDYQQIHLNDQYRIERTSHQALSMERIYIYKRKGLFEKNICRPLYSEIKEKILKADIAELPIQDAKLIAVNNDSIGIEYEINNTKRLTYHLINNNDGY